MSEKRYQSAKVYVLDFHFESGSKEEIAKKKGELDIFFHTLRRNLERIHKGKTVQQIFLRKH